MTTHRWAAILLTTLVVVYPRMSIGKAETLERPYDLELRIDCPQQDIYLGDEILITFTITNRDPNVFTHDDRNGDRSGRMEEYELVARYPDGRPVPDPREQPMPVIGGGLSGAPGRLWTGYSSQKAIALNLWARITEPGRYSVTGVYHYRIKDTNKKPLNGYRASKDVRVRSSPIEIQVKPRSHREMGDYIRDLTAKLKSLEGGASPEIRKEREHLAARLAYTCDARIVPTMLDLLYQKEHGNADFQAFQAFWCYLPHIEEIKAALLTAAKSRGLAGASVSLLEHLGCGETEFAELIRLSLSSNDPNAVWHAVGAAGEHPADEYMPKLIAIATGTNLEALGLPRGVRRESAIYAIANHRTDEGVAALKTLLNAPHPDIRKTTSDAIRYAYRRHPVYPEEVDEALTKALAALATDSRHIRRYSGVWAIARTRTPDGVKAVKTFLADPNADVPLAGTDLGVRTIRDLLRDSDPNVREHTRYFVEQLAYHESPGRPLRLDDFPPEFWENPEKFKQKTRENLLKD